MVGETSCFRAIVCRTEDEYLRMCSDRNRLPSDVPFIDEEGRSSSMLRIGELVVVPYQRYESTIALDAAGVDVGKSSEEDERSRTADRVVLSSTGTSKYAASVLARATGARLVIVSSETLLERACELAQKSPVTIALSLDEATDRLLCGLLEQMRVSLDGTRPWAQLPEFSLVVARNLAALSWVVAKIALRPTDRSHSKEEVRLVKFNGMRDYCTITEARSGSAGIQVGRRRATSPDVLDALTRAASAMAHSGHGSDACSNAGSGVWLCGRRIAEGSPTSHGRGVLACGLGQPCLQGPYPLRLSLVTAKVLMLCSCSSLRLADSGLSSDFNLGLEFLDGVGRAYVGTVRFQVPGAAPDVFLCGLAAGLTVAQSTNLANGYVCQSRLDAPAFISVGDPDDSIAEHTRIDAVTPQGMSTSDVLIGQRVKVASGRGVESNLVTFLFSHEDVLRAAQDDVLAFSVESSGAGEPIRWFYRIESRELATSSENRAESLQVRVFFFRFPEPFKELSVTPCNTGEISRGYLASMGILLRWIEILRLSGLEEDNNSLVKELSAACRAGTEYVSHIPHALRHSGATVDSIHRQRRETLKLADRAAHASLKLLVPELTRPWLLTNSFDDTYPLDESTASKCPYCDGPAIRQIGRNRVHGARRILDICYRCGTFLDIAEDDSISQITIEVANEILAGASFAGVVRVRPNGRAESNSSVSVRTRIFVPGHPGLSPWNEKLSHEIGTSELKFPFEFELPRNLLPNQCDIKCLVVSREGISFGRRPFVVT